MSSIFLFVSCFLLPALFVSSVDAGDCTGGDWTAAYNFANCDLENGNYAIECPDKNNAGDCGLRLNGGPHLGPGKYGANILSAPGAGTDTSFYLFSYGRNNDKSKPWNEIDIEILGPQVSGGQSRIWTNLWTGQGTQHGEYVTVPYNVAAQAHRMEIEIAPPPNATMYWLFDGVVYRWLYYGGFSDVVNTVNSRNFQAEMVLWGASNDDWGDMGQLSQNTHSFPIWAHFSGASLQPNMEWEAEQEKKQNLAQKNREAAVYKAKRDEKERRHKNTSSTLA